MPVLFEIEEPKRGNCVRRGYSRNILCRIYHSTHLLKGKNRLPGIPERNRDLLITRCCNKDRQSISCPLRYSFFFIPDGSISLLFTMVRTRPSTVILNASPGASFQENPEGYLETQPVNGCLLQKNTAGKALSLSILSPPSQKWPFRERKTALCEECSSDSVPYVWSYLRSGVLIQS